MYKNNILLNNLKKAFLLIRKPKNNDTISEVKLTQLKKLYPYLAKEKYLVFFAVLSTIFVSIITLPSPYIVKIIVDDVFPSNSFSKLNIFILILLTLQILRLLGSFLSNYYFALLNQKILLNIKQNIINDLLKMPMSFFQNSQTGYIISRFNEINGISVLFSTSTVRLLTGLIEFILSIFIMLYIDINMTLIAVLSIPVFYYIISRYSIAIRLVSRDLLEKNAQFSRKLYEIFSAILTVKIFASESREHDKINHELNDLSQINILQAIVTSISNELVILLVAVGGFVILWYSGYQIIDGSFTIGDYLAFSGYLTKVYLAIQTYTSMTLTIQPILVSIKRLSDLSTIDMKNKIVKSANLNNIDKIKGHIVFENVSFSYVENIPLLSNLYMEIKPGEKIGLIGDNGTGKTTILYLLLGLYKPDSGSIRIDGQDIEALELSSLRNKIGFISQEIFLFNDTIKNNIKYSKPNASDSEIIRAAEASTANEFINELAQRYQTMVGERGTKLSGGQKQRIALARVLLKDPDLLIIDEGTSEVDIYSEKMIRDMVKSIFKDKTCIIVAHRGATLEIVDRVIMLDRFSYPIEGA